MENKNIENKICKFLIISVLVFIIIAIIAIVCKDNKVSALESANGYHIEEIIEDKFNKETLDSSWILNDSKKEIQYNALHCTSPVSYGYGPIINGARLTDKTRYEFDIHTQSMMDGANISFNIGLPSYSGAQNETTVDCKVQLWNTMLTFVVYQNNLILPSVITSQELLTTSVNLYEADTTVAITVARKDSRTTEVYIEYYRNNQQVYSSESSPFVLKDPRTPNGYSGFFWDSLEMDLTNFKVYNDDKLTFEDHFETNTITFDAQDASLGNLHVTGLNTTVCYYANVSTIKMNSNYSSILNSYKLTEQENVSNPYELTYSLKINELNINSFVGFGFGLKDDIKLDSVNAIGLLKTGEDTIEVVMLKNGVVNRTNNYLINELKLSISKYQNISITLDYANNAYLTISDLTYKFVNVDYYGSFGVGVIDLETNKSSNIELNEFKLMSNTYKKYSSSDVSNDFSGTKLSEDGFADEPYLNNQKYFIGPQVTLEEDWENGSNAIVFTNSGAYSSFGVRNKYSEFVCEFDIEVLSRQNFQYIGLSFGRESIVDVLVQSSTTNKAFLFRCDNNGASSAHVFYGSDGKLGSGSTSENSALNIFDKDNTKYHMMFVAKNRNLYVYYKDINAPDSDLGILRSVVKDVNIDGYCEIVGANGATFKVTNYKLVNLSDECTSESAITLRESFVNKNNISDKLVVDALNKIIDERLVMNNSSFETVNPYLYEIIRFTTYGMDDNLQIKFSKDKKIVFDTFKNRIIIYEGKEETSFDIGNANLKNIKGKRFEIILIGNEIKIGYKGYYDPIDKLSNELISYTLKSNLSKDNISFMSNGKTIIDDLYVFALDNSMRCESVSYEEDPNNQNTWKIRDDFDPSTVYNPDDNNLLASLTNKMGCNSSISGVLSILPLFSLIIVFKRKRGNE